MQTEVPTPGDTSLTAPSGKSASSSTVASTAPGQLRVIKRNGAVVSYDESKIIVAITKAYLAVEGGNAAASSRIHDLVLTLGKQIADTFKRRMPSGGTIHIEDIQDQVELALMRSGDHNVARSYVLYRAERARQREQRQKKEVESRPALEVTPVTTCADPPRASTPEPAEAEKLTRESSPGKSATSVSRPGRKAIPNPMLREVFARAGNRCQRCGRRGGRLHAHHKEPVSDGGQNRSVTLTVLCSACHSLVHQDDFETRPPWRSARRAAEARRQKEPETVANGR